MSKLQILRHGRLFRRLIAAAAILAALALTAALGLSLWVWGSTRAYLLTPE